ncbi:MAG: glycosyltransferase family 4 protein [Bacteroidales bacterium]|nr:glycosyltransferase family 4 protein [Bacteroidales bacterium]MBN2821248.1 glycosyltransferase family 4 protein [Bacteroidales bacterium]
MKIIFIFGGMPHYLTALLNKIAEDNNLDVSVIIPKGKGKSIGKGVRLEESDNSQLFKTIRLDEYNGIFGKPYFKNISKTLSGLKPDILVVGWPYIVPYIFDFKTRRMARKRGMSLVFREIPFMVAPKNKAIRFYRKNPVFNEDLQIENPTGLRLFPWACLLNLIRIYYFSRVDATLAYTSSAYSIHQSFGIKKEKIFVTYNSPDTDQLFKIKQEFKQNGTMPMLNPFRILHVGRLVKWKKVDVLIDAIHLLIEKHPLIELHIIGKGPEEDFLKKKAESLGLDKQIIFSGAIYDARILAKETLSSAVYVLAGMGGLSINEAMAFGKPIICSRCDGTEKELVRDGYNGFYFKEDNVADLADKIDAIISNPDLLQKMGAHSESIIRNEINLHTVAEKFVACFRSLKE